MKKSKEFIHISAVVAIVAIAILMVIAAWWYESHKEKPIQDVNRTNVNAVKNVNLNKNVNAANKNANANVNSVNLNVNKSIKTNANKATNVPVMF